MAPPDMAAARRATDELVRAGVGRDDLLRSLRSGLGAGPGDPRFTSVLLGPRGSGKTVTLNMIEDIACNAGWLVLLLDASTSDIMERLEEHIEWARDAGCRAAKPNGCNHEECAGPGRRMAATGDARHRAEMGHPSTADGTGGTCRRSPRPTR
ncbi:MAG: ATP-binding protein [Acidimicrobiaceae bacterium]|nr:ATP-binding protein [Acidimicrobiaceae bacterium]MYC43895.1 ATP-binding protein [Acidimicrobiaceae bacterium]MYH88226.1 ATP-binding protein [Acidimicrobiaceae bacterium]